MKDISQMEREFEEYERSIQRLKQLERELNSLNSEGLEADTNAIKSKLKDPKKAEEVEKAFHELKEKINEKDIKRKVAEQIEAYRRKLRQWEAEGYKVEELKEKWRLK